MKKKVGRILCLLAAVMAAAWMPAAWMPAAMTAYGAEAAVTMTGGGTFEPEGTVRVTLTYSGHRFGTATAIIDYDDSVLEYQSCSGGEAYGGAGTLRVNLDGGTGSDQLSCKLKFTAKAVGASFVTATTSNLYNLDMESLQAETRSVKVSVTEAGAGTDDSPDPAAGTSADGKADQEDLWSVTIGATPYRILSLFSEDDIPKGFFLTQIVWKGETLDAIQNETGRVTLCLLENQTDGSRRWFFYDAAAGSFRDWEAFTAAELMQYEEAAATEAGDAGDEASIMNFLLLSMAVTGILLSLALGVAVKTKKDK